MSSDANNPAEPESGTEPGLEPDVTPEGEPEVSPETEAARPADTTPLAEPEASEIAPDTDADFSARAVADDDVELQPRRNIRLWAALGAVALAVVMIAVTPLFGMNFIPGRSTNLGIAWASLVFGMVIVAGTLFAATIAERLLYTRRGGDKALLYLLLALVGISTGVFALGAALAAWWLFFGLGFF